MNKKLSRIAAIALSAAMVTSAFAMSTSSAFAATTPTITPNAITYAAAFDNTKTGDVANSKNILDVTKVFTGETATVKASNDVKYGAALDFTKATYEISSGSDVATYDSAAKQLTLKKAGTFTVKATKAALGAPVTLETVKHGNTETYDVTTNTITVNATIKVYTNGTTLVLPSAPTDGTVPGNSTTMGINDTAAYNVYKVGQAAAATDATAKFGTPETGYTIASSNSAIPMDTATPGTVAAQKASNVHTGYTTISAVKYDTDGKTALDTAQSASLTVANYYDAKEDANTTAVDTTYGQDTKTILNGYNVTGMDIKVADGKSLVVTGSDASVGAVTATNIFGTATGSVTVKGGTVKSITTDKGAVVIDPETDSGNVTVGDVKTSATVKVAGAIDADKNSDKTYSSVKVGNVTANSNVEISSAADDNGTKAPYGLVTVGNVVSPAETKITTSSSAKTLTVGTISGVQGNYADCPYTAQFVLTAGKFTTGDLKYISKVSVSGKAELTAGAISTGTVGDGKPYGSETVTAAQAPSTISVTDKSKLTASSIYVNAVPAGNDGSVTVPANAFTIADNSVTDSTVTGLDLYVTGAKKGTVLYNANKVATALFNIPGITTVQGTNIGKNMYNYTAATVEFLGFQMNQSNVDLGKGASTTLTTTLLPDMDLPTGVTIAWSADKDTVKLTPSADGRTCTVTSTGYTAENVNGGNTVVVTANLMKDGAAYAPFNSSKATGTCTVNLTAETAPVLTTTVTDLDGKTTTVTPETVVKMTQSTYNTVKFSADKAGISSIAYITGNDKVAQTGTASAWNGTSGTYNVYANGAVGSKVGVFANGVKVFQIEIVDRPFKCDTTLDLDGVKGKALTVGQKYSFKITPADGTKIDTFTFLTANDSAVASWGFVKNADGTVTATIKALKATDKIGVYAKINNVTYKVFAAAVK